MGKDGAKYMSSSMLIFIGGLASIYAVIIARDKKQVTPNAIARMFADGIKTIAPAIGICVIGYMIGAMFTDLGVTDEMLVFMEGLNMGKFGIVVFICLVTCLLGMVIPWPSLVVIFGSVFITILAAKELILFWRQQCCLASAVSCAASQLRLDLVCMLA